MIFTPKAETDLWQTLLPPLAWSWHVYTPAATHMHSPAHTYAVKVWKPLCMITEQPKAPQGINNRPNPETTNTISGLQREVGGRVCGCVDVGGGYEHMTSICADLFTFTWLSICACMFTLASVIVLLACACVSVNNEPHTSPIPQGCCDLPGPVGFLHSNPPKTFTP